MKYPTLLIGIFWALPYSMVAREIPYVEYLEYRIEWNYLTVGYSTLGRKENVPFEGKKVWLFESTARGNATIQAVFPVEDRIVSLWDPTEKRTLWHEKKLQEGKYKRTNQVHFNYESRKAVWWQKQYSGNIDDRGLFHILPEWKEKYGTVEGVDAVMNDVLSVIHLTRVSSEKPIEGVEFAIPMFDDNQVSHIKLKILKQETISSRINGIESPRSAWVIEPKMETSGVFRSKGNILVWVSNDEHRYPLKIEAEIPFLGTVTANLFHTKN